MTEELREKAKIEFNARRGLDSPNGFEPVFEQGWDEGVRAERERVASRLQTLFEDVVNGSSPVTLLHCAMLTTLIEELRGDK